METGDGRTERERETHDRDAMVTRDAGQCWIYKMDDGRFGGVGEVGAGSVWRFQECQRQSFNLGTLFDPSFLDLVILISSSSLRAQINAKTRAGRLHGGAD